MSTPITFAAIVAAARRDAQLTAAEFDYQLNLGSEVGARAYQGLANAIWDLANEGHPDVELGRHDIFADRERRADALRERFADDIDRMIATAKTRCYTGWSDTAGAPTGPIRYADGEATR